MLTYKLVQPAFATFKLASLLRVVPVAVQVSTGKLEQRSSACSRVILQTYRSIILLRSILLWKRIFNLSPSLEQIPGSLRNVLIVTLVLCLFTVALVGNLESEKHLTDLIILLSPLRKEPNGKFTDFQFVPCRETKFLKRALHHLVQNNRHVRWYLRSMYSEFERCRPSFSIHDVLTIIVILGAPAFACLCFVAVIVGEPEEIFLASFLTPEYKKIQALRIAATYSDLLVFNAVAMNFHSGFFLVCAILAVYTAELKNLRRFIEQDEMKAFRSIRYVWLELRRLSVAFSIFNHVFSNVFYAGKILAFASSVLGSFYVLRFGITDVVSCGIAALAACAIVYYLLCLGNAYVITETMDRILDSIKFRSQFHTRICRRELKQRVKSLRMLALRDGGFREISQETTPEFVDFYVNQVIALVLTF